MNVHLPPGSVSIACEAQYNTSCPECGAELPIRKHAWQRFCSSRCRTKGWRATKRRAARTGDENDRKFTADQRAALEGRRRGEAVAKPKFIGNPKIDMEFLLAWQLAGEYAASQQETPKRRRRPRPLDVTDADRDAAGIDDDNEA